MSPLWILFGLVLGLFFVRWRWRAGWLRRNPPPPPSYEPALSWSVENEDERREAQHAEGEEFVAYRSVLRTTNLSRLMILQLQLDKAGIRHYRSQHNMLHGGEVQLFVEAARIGEAEELLAELDRDAAE